MAMPIVPGLLPQPEPTNNEPSTTEPGDGSNPLDAVLANVDEATMMEMAEMANAAYLNGELDAFFSGGGEEAPESEEAPEEGEAPEGEETEEAPAPGLVTADVALQTVQAALGEVGAIQQVVEELLSAADESDVDTKVIQEQLDIVAEAVAAIEEAEELANGAVSDEDTDAANQAVVTANEALAAAKAACEAAKGDATSQADDNRPEKSPLELWLESN